jgi:hypothetical protein
MTARSFTPHALLLVALLVLLPAPVASAVSARPDLVEPSLGNPPITRAQGTTFSSSERTANRGTARAGRSSTGFLLSKDRRKGRGDRRLGGVDADPALRAGSSSASITRLRVPASIPPGSYYVLACADIANRIRESNEANNCRASARKLRVSASSGPPSPPTSTDLDGDGRPNATDCAPTDPAVSQDKPD